MLPGRQATAMSTPKFSVINLLRPSSTHLSVILRAEYRIPFFNGILFHGTVVKRKKNSHQGSHGKEGRDSNQIPAKHRDGKGGRRQ